VGFRRGLSSREDDSPVGGVLLHSSCEVAVFPDLDETASSPCGSESAYVVVKMGLSE